MNMARFYQNRDVVQGTLFTCFSRTISSFSGFDLRIRMA